MVKNKGDACMGRSKKRNQKKQRQAVLAGFLTAVLLLVGAFVMFTQGGKDAPPSPDKHAEVVVSFSHGEGAELHNRSAGDVTEGEDHSLPVYLENYFGGKKDNVPTGDPHGGSVNPHMETESKDDEEGEKNPEGSGNGAPQASSDEGEWAGASLAESEGYLEVHFIDVGQGDASLIRFVDTNPSNGDDSAAMLVDAGDGGKGTAVRSYLKKQGVDELSYFVCTHPDADHIGGAASVVSQVPISSETVWGPDFEKDTKTYRNLMNEVFYKSYSYEEPSYGEEYSLGLAAFVFLAPTEPHDEANDNSLVLRIWYGDDSFLLVGDCELEEESEIISGDYASMLDSDVLKVGHHGSGTSSGEEFLSLVSPSFAVISCGEGNSYGHPHEAALERIFGTGAAVFRTDKQGSVVARATGKGILFDSEPCAGLR